MKLGSPVWPRVVLRAFIYALALDIALGVAVVLERSRFAPWMWNDEPPEPGTIVAGPVSSALMLPLLLLNRIWPSILNSIVGVIVAYTFLFTFLFGLVLWRKHSSHEPAGA